MPSRHSSTPFRLGPQQLGQQWRELLLGRCAGRGQIEGHGRILVLSPDLARGSAVRRSGWRACRDSRRSRSQPRRSPGWRTVEGRASALREAGAGVGADSHVVAAGAVRRQIAAAVISTAAMPDQAGNRHRGEPPRLTQQRPHRCQPPPPLSSRLLVQPGPQLVQRPRQSPAHGRRRNAEQLPDLRRRRAPRRSAAPRSVDPRPASRSTRRASWRCSCTVASASSAVGTAAAPGAACSRACRRRSAVDRLWARLRITVASQPRSGRSDAGGWRRPATSVSCTRSSACASVTSCRASRRAQPLWASSAWGNGPVVPSIDIPMTQHPAGGCW